MARSILVLLSLGFAVDVVVGQADPGVPKELVGVDIVENMNVQLPLDTKFFSQSGKEIELRDLFAGERPVLLQMGYFKCPQLCNLVLNEMTETLRELDWTTGREFDVVSISINPEESPELAAAKRTSYILMYERRQSGKGWHFLTGSEESARAVADAVGFRYRLQPDGEYAHAAGLFVITPDGRVSRYLYGASYDPRTMRFALLEASNGRIGSTLDRFIMWCHVYDPDSGSYVLLAVRLMQLGGVITLLVLVAGLGWMWKSDRKRARIAKLVEADGTKAKSRYASTDMAQGADR